MSGRSAIADHYRHSANCQALQVPSAGPGPPQISLDTRAQRLRTNLTSSGTTICPTPNGYVACVPALSDIYTSIAVSSGPRSRIRVLGYPHLFTNTPASSGCDLLPRALAPGTDGRPLGVEAAHISKANMVWVNNVVDSVNLVIDAQVTLVRASGVDISFVDPRPLWNAGSSVHGTGSSVPWINGVLLVDSSGSFHPKLIGQAKFADASPLG